MISVTWQRYNDGVVVKYCGGLLRVGMVCGDDVMVVMLRRRGDVGLA